MRIGQQAQGLRPDRPFWPGAGRGADLDQISTALTRAGAVVVVTGAAAMGKTRLALEATARVNAASIPCRTVNGDRHDDLNAIMEEMARLPEPRSTDTRARALLVVDRAEDAGAQTLERLILIAGATSISVMLVGRAELVGMLVRSVPERVCDAITRYVALEPLDADRTAEFVAHCLGDDTSPVTCGSDALRRISAHSRGVPGIIDRLMTDAVRLARLSRSARLTATVIDMIADEEHPPAGQPDPEVLAQSHARLDPPSSAAPAFRRKARPAAAPQPVQPQPEPDRYDGRTGSMRRVLTGLQGAPDPRHGYDTRYGHGGDSALPDEDADVADWPRSSADMLHPPARPARRIPPWAGGIAFVVVATSAIALQHYLQSGAPILTPADGQRAVVSSVLGDTGSRPAAPFPVRQPDPAQPEAQPSASSAEQVPMADYLQRVQVAVVESRMLSAPADEGEAEPSAMPEAAAEPSPEIPVVQAPATEPLAETMPESEPVPPAPAESVQPAQELPVYENEAIAPAEPGSAPAGAMPAEPAPPEPTAESVPEPEIPAPAVEAVSPAEPEEIPAEAVPVAPAPTAEGPAEPAPADRAAESAPPDAAQPPEPETPAAEMSPPAETAPGDPAPGEPVASEPELPAASDPPAAAVVPETLPQDPATEQTAPPEPAPEPTIAEPAPPAAPTAEPPADIAIPEPALPEPIPEQASPPEPEPAPTLAEPAPPPEPERPSPEPPAPAPAVVTAAPQPPPSPPTPAPAVPKPPSIAESVLLERGDRLLALGDIASARLLYESAAAGGSARGALLAGRTLDPSYLRSLGSRGVTGDPARAAEWYEKAAKLGDDLAATHLEALGRR
jgi:hypothetical protein